MTMLSDYPHDAGFKVTGTSEEAAETMNGKAATLRDAVRKLLEGSFFVYGLTADEAAAELRESVLSIRPRFSELLTLGFIKDSGFRRKNSSGRNATVWMAVAIGEQAVFPLAIPPQPRTISKETLSRLTNERKAIEVNRVPRGHKDFVPDYWFCCNFNTPKEKRQEMAMGDIYENAAICKKCGDYVRSRNRHDFRSCSCGSVMVDGGSWYTLRVGNIDAMIDCTTPFKDAL